MKKMQFFMEYLLSALLIGKAFTNVLPLSVFIVLFVIIYALVYKIDGFRLDSLYFPPLACLLIYGVIYQNETVKMMVCGSIMMMQINSSKIHHLPVNNKIIGFKRQIINDNKIYYQLYPLDTSKQVYSRTILWNQGNTVQKIIQSKDPNSFTRLYYKISLSYLQKIKMRIGAGPQKPTSNGMLFFHGKGTTPFWYSSILLHFASNNLKVSALQYEQQNYMNKQDELVDEYYNILMKMQCKNYVLLGNTAGCATIISLYHKYKEKIHKKITHIILLNPWFGSLSQETIQASINIPILIINNYHFLHFQNIHDINTKFAQSHKVEYIVWKKGIIINQTDLTFVMQTTGNENDSQFNFKMNLEAIDKFMKNEKVQSSFGQLQLGRSYKPESFQPFYYEF